MTNLVTRALNPKWIIAVGPLPIAGALLGWGPAQAQNRGVYPLGMSATNSGVTPDPGFTYSNTFLFYSRDQSKGSNGELLATGSNSVLMDMNAFVWVSKKEILGGARFSMSATLPIANNSLASDVAGAISGGGGFADSYYQPFILGWQGNSLPFERFTDSSPLPEDLRRGRTTTWDQVIGLTSWPQAKPFT